MDEHLRTRRPDLALDPAQHEDEREEDHRTWPGKRSLTDQLASQPRGQTGSGWPGRNALVNAFFSPAVSALPASMRAELEKLLGGGVGARAAPGEQLALMDETPDAGTPTAGASGSSSSDTGPAPDAAKTDEKATSSGTVPTPNADADNRVPAQHATWDEQKEPDARKKLEIDWLDGLDHNVHDSIFHKDAVDPKLQKQKAVLEKGRDAALKKAKTDAERVRIQQDYSEKLDEIDDKIENDLETETNVGAPKHSVTTPDSKTARKKHQRVRDETDFMSWAFDMFGKGIKDKAVVLEKIKKHFLGIRPVDGQPGMLLAEKARDRYIKARKEFEKENPGYTFPTSGSTQSMRHHHQDSKAVGKQGHALAISIDFKAGQNPNINPAEGTNQFINDYMITKFSGPLPD